MSEQALALHAAVTAYTKTQMRKQAVPSGGTVTPKGQFANSLLQSGLNDLKTQFDSLKASTPAIAADLDKVHKEMETTLTTQYNQLLGGAKFDQARWDKNFDFTDPNNSMKTALNNIQVAAPDDHQKILDSISSIQTTTINDEMGRLTDSVNRQKISADVVNAAKAAYGAKYDRVLWDRIDNPKPDLDFENSTMNGTGVGMGQNGLYHQDGSKFNIQIEGNKARFGLAEENWLSRKVGFQDRFHRYDNHKAGIKESIQALAVLGGFKEVEYDFPGINASQFGKKNLKQMQRALEAAVETLDTKEQTGMGANPKFDFSENCRQLLDQSNISRSDKENIIRDLNKYQARYAAFEQKQEQAKTAAAAPAAPAQPAAAAAAQPGAAASPMGGFAQQAAPAGQAAPAAGQAASAAGQAAPAGASPLGGFTQQQDDKNDEANRRSGPRPAGP